MSGCIDCGASTPWYTCMRCAGKRWVGETTYLCEGCQVPTALEDIACVNRLRLAYLCPDCQAYQVLAGAKVDSVDDWPGFEEELTRNGVTPHFASEGAELPGNAR